MVGETGRRRSSPSCLLSASFLRPGGDGSFMAGDWLGMAGDGCRPGHGPGAPVFLFNKDTLGLPNHLECPEGAIIYIRYP